MCCTARLHDTRLPFQLHIATFESAMSKNSSYIHGLSQSLDWRHNDLVNMVRPRMTDQQQQAFQSILMRVLSQIPRPIRVTPNVLLRYMVGMRVDLIHEVDGLPYASGLVDSSSTTMHSLFKALTTLQTPRPTSSRVMVHDIGISLKSVAHRIHVSTRSVPANHITT